MKNKRGQIIIIIIILLINPAFEWEILIWELKERGNKRASPSLITVLWPVCVAVVGSAGRTWSPGTRGTGRCIEKPHFLHLSGCKTVCHIKSSSVQPHQGSTSASFSLVPRSPAPPGAPYRPF